MPAIITVSNRLPITVGDTITKSSGGLVAALEGVNDERYTPKWLGWPGADIPPERQDDVRRTLETEFGCTPVFLTREESDAHYEGFSNSSIWPLLHYLPSYFRYEPHWWDHYRAVNQRFADRIVSMAGPEDLVWVHDYQLMLLPAMLREAMPALRVGFFLHTPFPSYEIFRCHPRRADLLHGLLGADLVGFHTFGYLRHLRSSVLRLLGIDSEIARIRHDGRETVLGVFPIGINAAKFGQALESPEHEVQQSRFRTVFGSKRIILSVERLDYTKGILRRLDAIDLFLADCPDRDGVKFIFVSIPSRQGIGSYQHLREDVEARIGRLNGKYATLNNSPIHFIHGSVNFDELTALYSIAEVCVVTPLADGMNLVAKEYVACQRENPGVLVLSEFAGAAEELSHALIVNPYDPQAVASAIRVALEMHPDERRSRMDPMRRHVTEFDAGRWAGSFVQDLASREPQPPAASNLDEARRRLADAFSGGGRIAFFLDYDGTLREIEREPSAARPNAAVFALLDKLRDRAGLDVTIISGRVAHELEAWLGRYPFALIAEHGASLRRPRSGEWEQLDRNTSFTWKQEVGKVLRLFEASTPGTFIEDKRTSLVWHYRRADPEFGDWKARQLVTELEAVTANAPLEVRHGKKIVEITSSHINKAAAVMRLLDETRYDLVLCAGDDMTDESMFRLELQNLITVHVGTKETQAQFKTLNPASFRKFLEEVTTRTG